MQVSVGHHLLQQKQHCALYIAGDVFDFPALVPQCSEDFCQGPSLLVPNPLPGEVPVPLVPEPAALGVLGFEILIKGGTELFDFSY